MSQGSTEDGQAADAGQQTAADQGQAGGRSGDQSGTAAGNAAGQDAGRTDGQQGQSAGQSGDQGQQQTGGDDGLTDEERAALTDPGRRALERIRGERETARGEVETLRGQLQQALAQINQGGDQGLQTQVAEATTRAETAERSTQQITALLRSGLAVPRQGEEGEAFANRMLQLAGMLQGSDQSQLDASAAVLASLGSGQQAQGQQRQTTGDTHAAGQGGAGAGKPSMDDLIRASAGRR